MIYLLLILIGGVILLFLTILYLFKTYKRVQSFDLSLKERSEVLAVQLFQFFRKQGKNLNYSIESMKLVEEFIVSHFNEKNAENLSSENKVLILCIGAYLAETIRKKLGAKWAGPDNRETELTEAVLLMPDQSAVLPFQKAIKRLLNGPEDNIYHYILVLSRKE